MQIDGKKILVTNRGGNNAVISTVLDVIADNLGCCDEIVRDLRGKDLLTQCYSIFDYVYNNVQYIEDDGYNQYIKTPARTLHDGFADCKSMTVLIVCCLYSLGIPAIVRFVDFIGNKIYTHVYAVAVNPRGGEIIIDPVERVNNEPKFDFASNYKNKLDYKIG